MQLTAKPRRELNDCRVLVTPTSYGKNDPNLKTMLEESVGEVIYNPTNQPLQATELRSLIVDVDGYIAGLDQVNRSVLEAANRLQVISRYGVGVDRVDIEEATRRGIIVSNTPGSNSAAVAELTISLMLAVARYLCQGNQATRRGEWPRFSGVSLHGKTVGLIGFGALGRAVAKFLKGFDCTIFVYDPHVQNGVIEDFGAVPESQEKLLKTVDFVSLHLSVSPATVGMVNAEFLQRMKPGSILINTARGELIDEDALYDALSSGHLIGAGLDCFCQEPPDPNNKLVNLPQVILTPHIGAQTDGARNAMGWMALEDCLSVLRGERPQHLVNPEIY